MNAYIVSPVDGAFFSQMWLNNNHHVRESIARTYAGCLAAYTCYDIDNRALHRANRTPIPIILERVS